MDDVFADRAAAGRRLAARVAALHLSAPMVLALPRGGVPVAAPVAALLRAPLELLLVRKIGAPGQPELAVGAVAECAEPPGHVLVSDDSAMAMTGASESYVEQEARQALQEIARRRAAYRAGRAPQPVAGRTVVLVDDGIATGTTVRAALKALRQMQPARLVLAVPVAPPDTVAALREDVDDLVCLAQPTPFHAVGLHYIDFHQVPDEEVVALMAAAARSA
ncbi:phosphoribosyltransferase [Aquabacterium sp.]|uniref:phosphoribosyltransferase n=1 Tax=Aquabacterium sp. TaxID=1872578 RepID=UPI0037836764